MANLHDLKGLKFVSINTNSLNLSSRQSLINSLNLFNQKLEGILSLNADISCLQDIRLGEDGKQSYKKALILINVVVINCMRIPVLIKEV